MFTYLFPYWVVDLLAAIGVIAILVFVFLTISLVLEAHNERRARRASSREHRRNMDAEVTYLTRKQTRWDRIP